MTTTTLRPHLTDRRIPRPLELDPTLAQPGAVLPDGNPLIPLPPSTHPAEEHVHPWVD